MPETRRPAEAGRREARLLAERRLLEVRVVLERREGEVDAVHEEGAGLLAALAFQAKRRAAFSRLVEPAEANRSNERGALEIDHAMHCRATEIDLALEARVRRADGPAERAAVLCRLGNCGQSDPRGRDRARSLSRQEEVPIALQSGRFESPRRIAVSSRQQPWAMS